MEIAQKSVPQPDFHFFLRFPSLVFLGNILPFVIKLFPLGKADFHFRPAVLKVNGKGDNRIALFRYAANKLPYLLPVQKKFPYPQGILIKNIALLVRAYMHSINKNFSPLNPDKGLLHTAFPHTQGFYFRPV